MPEKTRADLVSGLRELADFIESSELPLYIRGEGLPTVRLTEWFDKEGFLASVRLLGRSEKFSDSFAFGLKRGFGNGAVELRIETSRQDVCERKVIRTEKVKVEKPDPNVEVPMILVEEEREEVEWVCPDSVLGLSREAEFDAALGEGRR